MEKLQALNKAEEEEPYFPSDFWSNKHPRCPHCGNECDVNDHELWHLYEEGEHEVSCPHCGLDFAVSTTVTYSFSTDSQPDPEDDESADEGP